MRQKKRWMALGLAAMMMTTAAPMPTMAEELLSSGSEAAAESMTEEAAASADESAAADLLGDGQTEISPDAGDVEAVLEPSSEPTLDELAATEVLATPEVGEGETQAASSGKCGENVTWELSEEGVLTIKGSGPMYERQYKAEEGGSVARFCTLDEQGNVIPCPDPGWVRDQVKEVWVESGVTSIGMSMFFEYETITKVSLGDTVTEIKDMAFTYCRNLREISLPDSLTTIGADAFWDCGLESIQLPSALTNLGEGAFNRCKNLEEVEIPEGITKLPNEAFMFCTSLRTVRLPDTLVEIGEDAFNYCENLSEIVLPKNLTTLKRYAFARCGFKEVQVPATLKEMGFDAFYSCKNLEKLVIPEGVTGVGMSSFSECSALQTVSLPDTLKRIEYGAFSGCRSLKNIEIPDSVIDIGRRAFADCENLEKVSLPKSILEISEEMFTKTALREVEIPDSVLFIESQAFEECPNLEKVTFGTGVLKIKDQAFSSCENLKTLVFKGNAPRISGLAFSRTSKEAISAVYPRDHESWTPQVMRNYGAAKINWEMPALPELAAPTVKLANTNKGIKVSWNRIPNAKGYEVYRKVSTDKTYTKIATIQTDSTTSYVDAGTKSGKVYVYAVKAFYDSKHKSAHIRQAIRSLKTPTITKAVRGKNGVSLRWTAVSGAKGYYVYRKAGNGKYVRIATRNKVGAITFKDTKAKKGQTYTYAVRAFNGKSMSAFIGKTVK